MITFRCSGATVAVPGDPNQIRNTYRAYRRLLGLTPASARRRLVFTQFA